MASAAAVVESVALDDADGPAAAEVVVVAEDVAKASPRMTGIAGTLVPPLRFACVDTGIYRGSYPKAVSSEFMHCLELRTVISVTPEPLGSAANPDPFGLGPDVAYVHVESGAERNKSRKKRGIPLTNEIVQGVLELAQNVTAQPVYVHCLNGQQVTSLVIACFRTAVCGWSVRSAFAEWERFASYDRSDVQFVEAYLRSVGLAPVRVPSLGIQK